MTDLRALVGGRPVGRRVQQNLAAYVSTEQPLPASTTAGPVYVVIPALSTDRSIALPWPRSLGTTLPAQGDSLLLGYDEQYVPHIIVWF